MKQYDRVAYAAKFLRSIFDYSHERASLRGTVMHVEDRYAPYLVYVEWDDGTARYVCAANLVAADRIHLELA